MLREGKEQVRERESKRKPERKGERDIYRQRHRVTSILPIELN